MSGRISSLRSYWRRFAHWVRIRLSGGIKRLNSPPSQHSLSASLSATFGHNLESLSPEILEDLEKLAPHHPGVVTSTVSSALADYFDLRTLSDGPASGDIVDDVSMLAETQTLLAGLVERATEVAILAQVAGTRQDDRAAREAAGDAILELQDRERMLRALTSTALRWASSQHRDDYERYRACVEQMRSLPLLER